MLRRVLQLVFCLGVLALAVDATRAVQTGVRGEVSSIPAASAGSAQSDTKNDVWLFTTEPQMRVEIEKYLKKPRDTYYIIMRAQHEELGPAAAMAYREWRKKRIGDPLIESAYAFSQWCTAGELSTVYFTKDVQPLLQQVRGQQMEAQYYRTEAIKARPNSPEVLLDTALGSFFYTVGSQLKNKQHSATELRRVVRLAPGWADAHYWLGRVLEMLWPCVSNKGAIARESIQALEAAEKLNPAFRNDCLMTYVIDYDELKRPDLSLRYLDEYIGTHPKCSPRILRSRSYYLGEIRDAKRRTAKKR